MSMNAFRIFYRNLKLTLGSAIDDIHNHDFGGIAILYVEYAVRADRLCGMDLGSRRRVIIP